MDSIKVLTVDNPAHACDYLTKLVEITGCQAFGVRRRADFVSSLHCQAPDLLLLGSSIDAGEIGTFAQVVEREKRGLPILLIGENGQKLEKAGGISGTNLSFLSRDFNLRELKTAIEGMLEASRAPSTGELKELDDIIVGQTPAMMELKHNILRVSKSNLTVLIMGESGVGKEVVARAVHQLSPRCKKPFVKVNSAGLPCTLFESELFGFEKGAFTGAYKNKPGKFMLAHSGTIFLDEIGEIPLPMQAKLLQVLEDKELSPLGSTSNRKIDTRILAASNASLDDMVAKGIFRLDLFYRLNVVCLQIPPLRDRREDIDLLCEHFLRKHAGGDHEAIPPLSDRLREYLHHHSWTGNVRELENVILTISALGSEDAFFDMAGIRGRPEESRSPKRSESTAAPEGTLNLLTRYTLRELCKKSIRKAERATIIDALSYTEWNRKRAAELLKTSYRTLLTKIKEYEIKPKKLSFQVPYGATCQGRTDSFVSRFP